MSNMWVVARKEFSDLLSSHVVLFILGLYTVLVAIMVYNFNDVLNGNVPMTALLYGENVGVAAVYNVFYTLTWFGTIVGIIIGCSTIASERMGHALNTLVVKPLYRDTIINGKLLGSFIFMICFIIFTLILFTAGFFILSGNALAPHSYDYFSRLLFVFIFSMVYMSVFLSISVLISLLVKNQAFAMVLSTLTVYASVNVCFPNITSCLEQLLPGFGLRKLGLSISPYNVLIQLQDRLMDTSIGAYDAFLEILPDVFRLLVYVVIMVVLSYVIFVRSDIS